MSYISYAEFGRTEIYNNVSGKHKLQNEKIQKVNSLHHHFTQKKQNQNKNKKQMGKNVKRKKLSLFLFNESVKRTFTYFFP